MITEAEAKTKWCPMARASDWREPPLTINRNERGSPDADCLCIASACMAWRKGSKAVSEFYVTHDGKEERWNWDPTGHRGYEGYTVRKVNGDEKGCCGLAGKPE